MFSTWEHWKHLCWPALFVSLNNGYWSLDSEGILQHAVGSAQAEMGGLSSFFSFLSFFFFFSPAVSIAVLKTEGRREAQRLTAAALISVIRVSLTFHYQTSWSELTKISLSLLPSSHKKPNLFSHLQNNGNEIKASVGEHRQVLCW